MEGRTSPSRRIVGEAALIKLLLSIVLKKWNVFERQLRNNKFQIYINIKNCFENPAKKADLFFEFVRVVPPD